LRIANDAPGSVEQDTLKRCKTGENTGHAIKSAMSQVKRLAKHGGNIKMLAEKHGVDPSGVIDFSSNINPYGPPVRVIEAMKKALESISDYPEPHAESFIEAVSQALGVSQQFIVAGNGSIELLHLIAKLARDIKPCEGSRDIAEGQISGAAASETTEKQKAAEKQSESAAISDTTGIQIGSVTTRTNVLLPVPCFTEYELALLKTGANIRYFQALNSKDAVEQLSSNAENATMVIMGNPNNPCGYRIDKGEILRLVDRHQETIWVIDEAFIDFIAEHEYVSLAGDAASRENLVVVRSLTKMFSLAGVRIGFAVASKRIAEKLRGEKYSWSINSIAIAAGIAALKESDFVYESVSKLARSAGDLYKELSKLEGIHPLKPSVNYILIKIQAPISSSDLQIAMLKKGIAVRDCSSYTGLEGDYIRVAVKSPEQNAVLIKCISEVLGSR
jgi:threonine-phosphate decarboxylase